MESARYLCQGKSITPDDLFSYHQRCYGISEASFAFIGHCSLRGRQR
ncbi:hypothetical protein TCAL_16179 [Tigriopus californicus]|uniref:Uncharacterized protein n=1 Tax=Tigriopus californicus TaxID=6832 RepID=A0A553P3K8_TIGCA|nr:hypothetical protein TCAL_16179 [Tigriopus californicus]